MQIPDICSTWDLGFAFSKTNRTIGEDVTIIQG
jgi:hypothetical protein